MTRPKRYKRYSADFKREALRRAAEEGMTDKFVCDELGISTWQFRDGAVRWNFWEVRLFQGTGDRVIRKSPL